MGAANVEAMRKRLQKSCRSFFSQRATLSTRSRVTTPRLPRNPRRERVRHFQTQQCPSDGSNLRCSSAPPRSTFLSFMTVRSGSWQAGCWDQAVVSDRTSNVESLPVGAIQPLLEATWNPVVGCNLISPGCTNCYAMRMARRLEAMGQPIAFDRGLLECDRCVSQWFAADMSS